MKFSEKLYTALRSVGNHKLREGLKKSLGKKLYVVGKNYETRRVKDRLNISGLIDSVNTSETHWAGLPVVPLSRVERDSVVINLTSSISPVNVRRWLNSRNDIEVIELSDLINDECPLISLPKFVLDQREEIASNEVWWDEFYEQLEDDYSKQTLFETTCFRMTAALNFMESYEVRLHEQYLETFMEYDNEIFVDAGGYDGDTSEEFAKYCSRYKKIYFFEPSEENMFSAVDRLKEFHNIEFIPLGLSDKPGYLYFDADMGSASSFNAQNDKGLKVQVTTLDKRLKGDRVSFIKMDIEGWELRALFGAKETIRKFRPKMAIAIYHAAKDLREITDFVMSLNPSYKIYLRHYTQGWSESILYFK